MEERRKMGRVERGILNVLGGYEKKVRISQKEAPAVRKVYRIERINNNRPSTSGAKDI